MNDSAIFAERKAHLPQTAAEASPGKTIDPMKHSNTLDWPVDGLDYQKQVRGEWQ